MDLINQFESSVILQISKTLVVMLVSSRKFESSVILQISKTTPFSYTKAL